MTILLWDTRRRDVSKDFAGGFGVGMYRGGAPTRAWVTARGTRSSDGSIAATADRRHCSTLTWPPRLAGWGIK